MVTAYTVIVYTRMDYEFMAYLKWAYSPNIGSVDAANRRSCASSIPIECPSTLAACEVMAHIVVVHIVMANINMANIVMAEVVNAYMVMAY